MQYHFTRRRTRKAFVVAMARPLEVFVSEIADSAGVSCIVGEVERAGGSLTVAGPKSPFAWAAIVRFRDGKISVFPSNAGATAKPLVEVSI